MSEPSNQQIFVTKPSLPPIEDYIEKLRTVWENQILTNMGEYHFELEKELRDYLETEFVTLFCNGHFALEMCIQAFDLSGEVITTPFTFASTTHAIVRNNLEPVFCDISPETYTIDPNKIEQLITKKTSAIIPVHVYGHVCDIEAIDYIAKKYGLRVIYDAAHAFGTKYKDVAVGNFGNASMFSFHATKVFSTIEGGGVTYSDKDLERKLVDLKNFGIHSQESVKSIGANCKMNEFQAAMGLCNLKYLQENIEKRRIITERYYERLSDVRGIELCDYKQQGNVSPNYSYLPVIFDQKSFGADRNAVADFLIRNQVFPRKYFYPLVSRYECYSKKYGKQLTPIAEKISERVLTLPLYPDLSIDDVDRITNLVLQCQDA